MIMKLSKSHANKIKINKNLEWLETSIVSFIGNFGKGKSYLLNKILKEMELEVVEIPQTNSFSISVKFNILSFKMIFKF